MAFGWTPKNYSTFITALVKQATGQAVLANATLADYVSAGETAFRTAPENTMNSLTMLYLKTRIDIRKRQNIYNLIEAKDLNLYETRLRKIIYFAKESTPLASYNTDTHTNLHNGYDNGTNGGASVGSQWEQNKPACMELFFGGFGGETFGYTFYPEQMEMAFGSPSQMGTFWDGTLTEFGNRIDRYLETQRQSCVLNYFAGLYDLEAILSNGMAKNMTTAFNTYYNISPAYTTQELLTTHLREFLGFFLATLKEDSDRLAEESTEYHWNPSVTRDGVTYTDVLRQTPIENQRLLVHKDLFYKSETMVLPEIFHDNRLEITSEAERHKGKFEKVPYWQSRQEGSRMAIKITPAIPDTTNPSAQTTGTAVDLTTVIGALFDEEACEFASKRSTPRVTPVEARKNYQNTWVDALSSSINDFTHSGILYYMAD